MRRYIRAFSLYICITVIIIFSFFDVSSSVYSKENSINLSSEKYVFETKNKYLIDSAQKYSGKDKLSIGNITLGGNITNKGTKDGIPSYTIADGCVFTLDFTYNTILNNAGFQEWHLKKDNSKYVNGIKLKKNIKYGAIILETSLDGKSWFVNDTISNVKGNIAIGENIISSMQLYKGCYYRITTAFKTQKKENKKKVTQKNAEVYIFYASYQNLEISTNSEKFYYYVGGKNTKYTARTKDNAFSGNIEIEKKDPHYGWDLGCFCLSGYTDKGDSDDVYLKKAGNKIKLSFRLDEDIECLHGNPKMKIHDDDNGSDEEFKVKQHNMKHGELIVHHIDSENRMTETKYSDFFASLASPGTDTSIQFFEEGDYEVHLDYTIVDGSLFRKKYHYKTSFSFKIRNGNCMVYIFDAETGSELGNGDVAENGFQIDTARSSYPKLHVKKEILNNSKTGLTEDTRFNASAFDGEIFTDEGIYTITAYNRYDDKLEPAVKKIYVGSDKVLKAYIYHLGSSNPYTIDQINNMVENGYIVNDNGQILTPDSQKSIVKQQELNINTSDFSTQSDENRVSNTDNDDSALISDSNHKNDIKPVFLYAGCIVVVLSICIYIIYKKVYKKK